MEMALMRIYVIILVIIALSPLVVEVVEYVISRLSS